MTARAGIPGQWEQYNRDIDKLGARAINLLNWGGALFVIGAIVATSGFFIIIVIATALLVWGLSMRRRVYRLRDIAYSFQGQGVSPDSTAGLSEAKLNSSDILYSAPKARVNPINGFDSSNPVNNKGTDYSKEWAQLETEINELAQRANWIFKTTNILYLSVILAVISVSTPVFIYPEMMYEITITQWLIIFFMGINVAILTLPVYLLIRSFLNAIPPYDSYDYGIFFIEVFFVNKIAMMEISALTHSSTTAIVTSVIIAVIAAYRLFGSSLDRHAKRLRQLLNPHASRQTPLPLN